MSKHTEGPWKVDKELGSRNWIISLDAGDRGRGIAIAETRSGVSGQSELANANLIAAAPKMYSLLAIMAENGDIEAMQLIKEIGSQKDM